MTSQSDSPSSTTEQDALLEPDPDRLKRYQKWHLWITGIGVSFAGTAVVVAIFTLSALTRQVDNLAMQTERFVETTKLQNSLLKVQAYQAFSNDLASVEQAYLARPELRAFFYGGQVSADPALHPAAITLAEMYLDMFEVYFVEDLAAHTPWGRKGSEHRANWERYMRHIFEQSSVLCERLKEVRDWYSNEFVAFATPPCEKRGVKLN